MVARHRQSVLAGPKVDSCAPAGRLAAPGGPSLPGQRQGPLGAPPRPRGLERATCKLADPAALPPRKRRQQELDNTRADLATLQSAAVAGLTERSPLEQVLRHSYSCHPMHRSQPPHALEPTTPYIGASSHVLEPATQCLEPATFCTQYGSVLNMISGGALGFVYGAGRGYFRGYW